MDHFSEGMGIFNSRFPLDCCYKMEVYPNVITHQRLGWYLVKHGCLSKSPITMLYTWVQKNLGWFQRCRGWYTTYSNIYIYIYTHAYTHIYGYIGIRPSHEKDPCDFTSMIMACNQVPDGFAHGLGEQARMLVQQGNQSCSGYLERCFWMIQPPKKLVRVSFMMIFSNMLGSSNIISPVILKHHLTKENRFL